MPDEIDFRLIRELQKDSRQKNTDIAEKLGLSEATVRRRVENLINQGMVNFTIILNPEAAGFNVSAFMAFQVQPQKIAEIAVKLAEINSFYSISVTTGSQDIVASAYFTSVHDIYRIVNDQLKTIDGITKIETSVIVERIKRAY